MKKFLIILLIVMVLMAGCSIYDAPFFENYTSTQLVIGVVTILVAISQALFPKISLMQYLKTWLPWLQGELAYYITMIFLFGLSALALWISGEYDPTITWTLDKVIVYYGILATISQGAYQRLKSSARAMQP